MISFSGIDCGGKSTQVVRVANALKDKGKRCRVIHSRGGYTPMLEFFKTIIRRDRKDSSSKLNEYRESIHRNPRKRRFLLWLSILDVGLYYGICFRVIELFGITILADRYFWDSYIDFMMKYPEYDFEKWCVWKFAKAVYLEPKYSIIYTIPAELSMYRSTLKDEPWPESVEVRCMRIDKYMEQIRKGRWKYVIDATGTIDDVFNETKRIIDSENQ